ncbi:hypothetical protein FGG08_002367 [Glutinoglossum americanum]|uniref:Uncharacterized protein n=1 Tax=Glutinoglossum americanum TaxID=1670608 RepID=A0A9P8L1R9_9PEZI|nr:hypothetical protein FGG08_002367 [Glutinoglossum americanum]
MSTYELEAEIAQVADPSALPILRFTLDRCRDARYRVRDRREQLLGEFVTSWHRLQSTLRRTNQALTQLSSSSVRRRLYLELQEGTAVSRNAARTLASAIPTVNLLSRTRERSDYFLDNIAEAYEIRSFISMMQSTIVRLQDAMAEAVDDDGMPVKGRGYNSNDGYDDNYTMSRGPSSIYDDGHSTTSPRMSRMTRGTYDIESVNSNPPYLYSPEGAYEPAMPRGYRASSSSRRLLAYSQY